MIGLEKMIPALRNLSKKEVSSKIFKNEKAYRDKDSAIRTNT
jgi:hypothetical protein